MAYYHTDQYVAKSDRKLPQKNQCLQYFVWRSIKWPPNFTIKWKKYNEKKYFLCVLFTFTFETTKWLKRYKKNSFHCHLFIFYKRIYWKSIPILLSFAFHEVFSFSVFQRYLTIEKPCLWHSQVTSIKLNKLRDHYALCLYLFVAIIIRWDQFFSHCFVAKSVFIWKTCSRIKRSMFVYITYHNANTTCKQCTKDCKHALALHGCVYKGTKGKAKINKNIYLIGFFSFSFSYSLSLSLSLFFFCICV